MQHLYLPKDISGAIATDLAAQVRAMPPDQLTVHVDTNAGTDSCYDLAEALWHCGLGTTAFVGAEAKAEGLIVAVSCGRVICKWDSRFRFQDCQGQEEAIHKQAKWFAIHAPVLFEGTWYELMAASEPYEFAAARAYCWGIVHEIQPRERGY